MAARGHRSGKIATHQCCYGNTWYVILEDEEMEKTLGLYHISYARFHFSLKVFCCFFLCVCAVVSFIFP